MMLFRLAPSYSLLLQKIPSWIEGLYGEWLDALPFSHMNCKYISYGEMNALHYTFLE